MEINKKTLKKVFAISSVSLYAIGLACSCHDFYNDGLRIITETNALNRQTVEVYQDFVLISGTSIDDSAIDGVINYDGQICVPVWQYNFTFRPQTNYVNGEAIICLYEQDYLLDNLDEVYQERLGDHAVWARWLNDLGDFQYDSVSYNIFDFLISYGSAPYKYQYKNYIRQFGFNFMCDYDYNNRELELEVAFNWKSPVDNSWLFADLRYLLLSNIDLDETFVCNYVDRSYDNLTLAQQLNYANQGNVAYQQGIDYVIENPNEFNLYTLMQYLSYGTQKYNEGLEAGSNALSFSGLINEIFKAPISMFYQVFTNNQAWQWRLPNNEVLDIGGLMTFLLTIGIALAIVRLIMKIGGK